MKTKLLLAAIALIIGHYLQGATLSVTDPGNSGPGTLRDQIAAANAGDKIVFATTDTIRLTSGISISVAGLEITGFGGPEVVIKGAWSHRLFAANADSIKFKYLTMTKGRVYSGGSQAKGGAIYTSRKGIEVAHCNFVENRVHNTSGTSGGGAIAVVDGGTMTVDNSHFTKNTSQNCVGGGAIFVHRLSAKLTITNSSFYDNVAHNNLTGSRGGAVCCWAGRTRMENCTFSNNGVNNVATESYAYGNGGAVAAIQGGIIDMINNTVVNNYIQVYPNDPNNGGAGVFVDHGSTSGIGDFLNNLIGDNIHTITSDNSTIESDFTIHGGTEASDGYNLIENITGGGTFTTQSSDILNQAPNVGVLTTHSGYHKYHPLTCTSPGWNKGTSNITAFMDQLGVNRNVHGAVDMGSIEYQNALPTSPLLTLTHINTCYGDSIGAAEIAEPSKKITHTWSTNDGGNSISDLKAGMYTVLTTNSDGCGVLDTFYITQPDSITITGAITHDAGGNSGAVDISVSGGQGLTYSYNWMPGSYQTQDISNVAAGDYQVTVSDSLGCENEKSFTINLTTGVSAIEQEILGLYPNPATNQVSINSKLDIKMAQVYNAYGKLVYSGSQSTISITNLSSGTYFVTVTTIKGQSYSGKLMVK